MMFQQLRASADGQQLICFPYLGGSGHAFFKFANTVSISLDIWSASLPGHGAMPGKLLYEIDEVIELSYNNLKQIVKPNYLLFGHSMGGIIAYFLAQRILNSLDFKIKPAALILSASAAPSSFTMKNYSNWLDEDLLQYLISYGGIPDEILNEKNLLEYFMPIFRADFSILEKSSLLPFEPMNIPVYYFCGENDKIVTIDSAIQWSKYFMSDINLVLIEKGSHLFIHDQVNIVVEKISSIVHSFEMQAVN